ncbi:unnamed protein product [Nesidiocoris tenuis]|uniref:Uncharacterized protein n=1 Tax=Nesidiocoris tenuis TaxID=355587 RepID=A0A6H5HFS2_9HEMI|nr:unnamed protein product [Nesidiocoris tenuis]
MFHCEFDFDFDNELISISIMSLTSISIMSLTSISIMSLRLCFIVSLTSISIMSLRFCFIVVELGVYIRGIGPTTSNVSLLYTSSSMYVSQTLASFIVPTSFSTWSTVGIAVKEDRVDLSLNCALHNSVYVVKNPQELDFDSASTLYIGQAGPIIHGALHVSN